MYKRWRVQMIVTGIIKLDVRTCIDVVIVGYRQWRIGRKRCRAVVGWRL